MSDWKDRLKRDLEPALMLPDPRPQISAYHNMPCAIFHYPPEQEFPVRSEVRLLATRLEQAGKRVTWVSLAECLLEGLASSGLTPERIADAEKRAGVEKMADTVHAVISKRIPLDDAVVGKVPNDADPLREVVFVVRAGALFPFYRTSSLLEQLAGKITVPTVLFYPGELEGATGLKFMGLMDAEHNYRPKIF
jgi:hypothetical protein